MLGGLGVRGCGVDVQVLAAPELGAVRAADDVAPVLVGVLLADCAAPLSFSILMVVYSGSKSRRSVYAMVIAPFRWKCWVRPG